MTVRSGNSVRVETVGIVKFRDSLRAFVDKVEWRGMTVIIERNGRPVARLVPIDEAGEAKGEIDAT